MPDALPALTLRVSVACAALLDIGRPDLAVHISPNKRGHPSWKGPQPMPVEVVRAIRLGHLADPDGAPVTCPMLDPFAEVIDTIPACPVPCACTSRSADA